MKNENAIETLVSNFNFTESEAEDIMALVGDENE